MTGAGGDGSIKQKREERREKREDRLGVRLK